MLIGAVADDITGATDLCLMLSRQGLKTIQVIGVPSSDADFSGVDAIVIALKSRTILAKEAVALSCAAARVLLAQGAQQILFKYCSTFDSTDAGNIGPVAEALMDMMGVKLTIACPSFPTVGRTTYKGHLFVDGELLSESPLKDHPLTPMRDSNLVRVLSRQTALPIGLVDIDVVRKGEASLRNVFAEQYKTKGHILVLDSLTDDDLLTIGAACAEMRLVTGSAGIAMGLAQNFIRAGKVQPRPVKARMMAPSGRAVTLAGSSSVATRGQISTAQKAGEPSFRLDVEALSTGQQTIADITRWAIAQPEDSTPIIYSSAPTGDLQMLQQRIGRHEASALVESVLAGVAVSLHSAGFRRFLVAGGETSGAIVASLGISALEIGPEIDPGVPWTRSVGTPDIALGLKSGNFGAPDFFLKAWALLDTEALHA